MASAMRRVSVRNLLAHKVRLTLTVISVVLGTAFVAGSFIFTDTLKHSFTSIFGDAYKGISTHVQTKHDYDPGIPFAVVDKIKGIDGVKTVQPDTTTPVVVVNAKGKKIPSGGAPSEAGTWYGSENIGKTPTFQSGRAPERSGEVVLNTGAAKKGHIKVGDRIKLVLPNKPITTLTVTGLYKTKAGTGGYVGALLNRDQALSLLTDGKYFSAVDVSAQPGVSQKQLTDRIAKVLPAGVEAITGKQLVDDTNKQITNALSFINYVLLAFGFIALIVGTFIIYNTFSMIIAQRLRELALLRAVGASRKQVRRSVLLEATIIGIIGSVLGILGGVGLAYGLRALLDALNVGLPSGALRLIPRTVIVAFVIGIGVTLLSAYAPARRAATIPPVAAMREEFSAPERHQHPPALDHRRGPDPARRPGHRCRRDLERHRQWRLPAGPRPAPGRRRHPDAVPVAVRADHQPVGPDRGSPVPAGRTAGPHQRPAQPAPHRGHRIRADPGPADRQWHLGARRVGQGQHQQAVRHRRRRRRRAHHPVAGPGSPGRGAGGRRRRRREVGDRAARDARPGQRQGRVRFRRGRPPGRGHQGHLQAGFGHPDRHHHAGRRQDGQGQALEGREPPHPQPARPGRGHGDRRGDLQGVAAPGALDGQRRRLPPTDPPVPVGR